MMGLAQIEAESRKAARSSAALHLMPLIAWRPDEVFAAPFLGTRVPKGWRLATYADIGEDMRERKGFYGSDALGVLLFVDMSGWGGEGEPALSRREVIDAVEAITTANLRLGKVTLGWGIYEVGQFQGHLRLFVKRPGVPQSA